MTAPTYEVGNTVQAGETQGVTRVLADEPIKYIDLPHVDESINRTFPRTSERLRSLVLTTLAVCRRWSPEPGN